ncbi:MAG: c-type cytochrome [Prosthecobacter sp.]|jgi:putative membrane-bound dehydrogenase-like protein|uniref:PVC-type heme-binding CxxCH protein n=1 Tax=Prosthecobacter sp. TaxID=1965333 RepID=UPI0019EF7F59|nr:PVC-type heme-binding CxxCH protein [Prosthecobacter sp.]MBE2283235.1 c-type cytochrome [Prosthecobacter sp.]
MKPILLSLCIISSALAADFPALYNSEPGNPSPMSPMSPQEALKALKLPEGFKATLFAAEPDVQNPIAMSWDGKGRMWVAENYTYAERTKRFDLGLKDRVIILEDKDWDGIAETRKVFTEDVQMLTGVEVGRGGVWLMCPPQVLFIPDANGDDIPDGEPQVVIDGFTVAKDNYHNFANGLRFAPDDWLYGRCGHSCPGKLGIPGTPEEQRVPMKGGIWRYHPEKKIVEVLTHGTTNPWGHDWDANGEMFFINTVTGHLWHLIHGAHLMDSSTLNPLVYEKLDTIADHYHYDRSGKWSDSRDGKANSFGGGHAHIGMMIYQADQWPEEYRNKLFTLNMHGRRANVERLERNGSGYVGKHEPDVFLSDDPWFRGIEIRTGPDGSGFILDWSDTGECHESTGVHRTSGRIFRISYGEPKKPEKPFAWRKPWPKAGLKADVEHMRVQAIREHTQFWPIDSITGPQAGANYPDAEISASMPELILHAKEDVSGLVRLTLASVLQRLPLDKRPALAIALLSHTEDANDPFLSHMVWYGISPLKADALLEIAKACSWPKVTRWIARKLATEPEALNALLAINSSDDVLEGMAEAFKGIRKAPKPTNWDKVVASSKSLHLRDLSILFGDGRALDDVKKIAMDDQADIAARESALKTLIEACPDDLRELCTKLIDVRGLNTTAARGLALFDDPEIGKQLAKSYRKFATSIMDTLVARPAFAKAMLAEMAAGRIPRTELSAFHARQIRAFNDEALSKLLIEAWGELRESAADKKQLIEKLKADLKPEVLKQANLSNGRMLFTAVCGACHMMYGQGGKIGPDLTGSGRASLDYLLENIADPSGVVSADYRMSILTLKDGRQLSGVIAEKSDRTLSLRTLTETLTLDRSEITKTDTSPLSMMPEGLLLAFPPDPVRDLIAYLMHPVQVKLPDTKP